MYCTKSHIHFQVSSSPSEIFNKNLKIGRFYPGLPYQMLYQNLHAKLIPQNVNASAQKRFTIMLEQQPGHLIEITANLKHADW